MIVPSSRASAGVELRGYGIGDDERVVTAGDERRRDAAEKALAVMLDRRHLAVHRHRRTHDRPAERQADALMSEAHAQQRHALTHLANQLHCDARILGTARSRRDDDALRAQPSNLVERDFVVPAHEWRRAQLAEVLREVERERIVVVEQQYHSPVSAMASACNNARALSLVSSYSAAGFESATMPAPAWTRATPSLIVIVRIAMQKSRLPAKSM